MDAAMGVPMPTARPFVTSIDCALVVIAVVTGCMLRPRMVTSLAALLRSSGAPAQPFLR